MGFILISKDSIIFSIVLLSSISLILECICFILKLRINKIRHEDFCDFDISFLIGNIQNQGINVIKSSQYSYNYAENVIAYRQYNSYSDLIMFLHEYSHALHNKKTKGKFTKFFAISIWGIIFSLFLFVITWISNINFLVFSSYILIISYMVNYILVIYMEIHVNKIFFENVNRSSSIEKIYILSTMIKEFVFRFIIVLLLQGLIKIIGN